MKENSAPRLLKTTGVRATADFGISRVDEVHIMGILRDTLYSDKVLAVLREYSSNAWDANRVAGRGDRPIEVHLPEHHAPTLTIRDHGPGLSQEDVFTVYTQYGASTKRGDDITVGKLGIGSKSSFAYSDSFTITSWHGGKKAIYIAVLDESNRGRIDLVHEESLDGTDETGVEISVAVRIEDIEEFRKKAQNLFKHYSPRPEINVDLDPVPEETVALKNGSLVPLGRDEGGEWVAIMGCVPYRVNLDQLDASRLNKALKNLSGTIVFDIGAVEISASREELKYSSGTKNRILTKFDELIDEYVEQALNLVTTSSISEFDKRLRLLVLGDLGLDVPEEWESFSKHHVKVVDPLTSPLSLVHNTSSVGSITVTKNLRIIIDDVGGKRNLKGYSLGYDDYVVRSKTAKTKTEDLVKMTNSALAAANLTGVPVVLLSTMNWMPTRNGRGYLPGSKNVKHKVRTFVLTDSNTYSHPYSTHWKVITRAPEKTDVFVIVENFKVVGNKHFFDQYVEDREIAKAFGVALPPVYGYKSTKKAPMDGSKIVGTSYETWRELFVEALKTPVNLAKVEACNTRRVFFNVLNVTPRKETRAVLTKTLGKRHQIIQLLATYDKASKLVNPAHVAAVNRFASRIGMDKDKVAQKLIDDVWEAYPLLGASSSGIRSLWQSDYIYSNGSSEKKVSWREWMNYVVLVDRSNNLAIPFKAPSAQISATA